MSKALLITGCSSGIGKGIAEELLSEGYTIYATARNIGTIKDLKDKGAITLPLDVTKQETIDAVIERITADGATLYGLINNAGYGQIGPIEEVTAQQAFDQMNTNVLGLASVTRTTLPLLRKEKQGYIINMASIAGQVSMPMGGWYSASKYAVEALSDALRLELYPFGIKVAIVEPGPIRTNFGVIANTSTENIKNSEVYGSMLAQITNWSTKTLNDREAGKPKDVAKVIAKILRSKNPRPRYRVTRIAKFLYILRRLSSDKLLDKLFIKSMELNKLKKANLNH